MNILEFNELNEIDESELISINGGITWEAIALAGGVVCAAGEVYDFARGFGKGMNKAFHK